MGLCASKNEKKKPIQPQEKQTVNTQTFIASAVTTHNPVLQPLDPILETRDEDPLKIASPDTFDLQDNPQNVFFSIERDFKVTKVKRVSEEEKDGEMCTFFKNGAIPKGELTEFNVKQRVKDKIFNIGIGTKATYNGKASSDVVQQESIQLWVDNKYCYIGKQKFLIPQLYQTTSLKILVNTIQWTINWIIGGINIVTKPIPEKMRDKSFYLTVGLYNNHDEVQFMQE